MMDRTIKARWLEALRSGRYKQTRGVLNRSRPDTSVKNDLYPVGMCCLGVLCDVLGYEWHKTRDGYGVVDDDEDPNDPDWHPNQLCITMPPKRVLEHAKLPLGLADELAELNDGMVIRDVGGKATYVDPEGFKKIADYIETNL